MCETCGTYNHSGVLTNLQVNSYDPTRTTTLRNAFVSAMNRRFKELARVITKAIVDDDCFGLLLQTNQMNSPGYHAFDFPRTADKMDGFMRWLQLQVDKGILETTQFTRVGSGIEQAWTNTFIYDSYKR